MDHVRVPGGVVRPLVDPIPLYAWSMAWRRDAASEGLSAIRDAAAVLARAESWLEGGGEPAGAARWLPEPDASRLANGDYRLVTARARPTGRARGTRAAGLSDPDRGPRSPRRDP